MLKWRVDPAIPAVAGALLPHALDALLLGFHDPAAIGASDMFSLTFVPLDLESPGTRRLASAGAGRLDVPVESLGFRLGRLDVDLGGGPPPTPSNHLMMVLPSAALLLDQARSFFSSRQHGRMEFVGTGSSFVMTFTRTGSAVRVTAPAGTTTVTLQALAEELLRAAAALDAQVAPFISAEDPARADLRDALADFRQTLARIGHERRR